MLCTRVKLFGGTVSVYLQNDESKTANEKRVLLKILCNRTSYIIVVEIDLKKLLFF